MSNWILREAASQETADSKNKMSKPGLKTNQRQRKTAKGIKKKRDWIQLLFLTCKFNNTADALVADDGDKLLFWKGSFRKLRFFSEASQNSPIWSSLLLFCGVLKLRFVSFIFVLISEGFIMWMCRNKIIVFLFHSKLNFLG